MTMLLKSINDIYKTLITYNIEPGGFNYYFADSVNSNIYMVDIFEIDIVSAGQTICEILFNSTDPKFIENIKSKSDKTSKSIVMSTTLKEKSTKDNVDYIGVVNRWCKILCLGYVFNNWENVKIIEYKKDGCIFSGSKLKYPFFPEMNIDIDRLNIKYHNNDIRHYCRVNKTTFMFVSDALIIKGQYKNAPVAIEQAIRGIFNKDFNLADVKNLYTTKFSEILITGNLKEEFEKLYLFDGNYINCKNKLTPFKNSISIMKGVNPERVLTNILYPILALLKS